MSIFETISRPLFNGGVFRTDLLAETHYFYCTFNTGSTTPKDKVSKESMQTSGLAAGRVSYHGGPYAVNEPAIDKYGLFGCGAYTQLLAKSEDFSSAPWVATGCTNTPNIIACPIGSLTASMLEFDGSIDSRIIQNVTGLTIGNAYTFTVWLKGTNGEKITIEALLFSKQITLTDEWVRYQLDIPSSVATYTVIRLIYRSGDTATTVYAWGGQLTEGTFVYPYAENNTSSWLAIPENFSDTDQGYKFSINAQLLTALTGTDGTNAQGKLTVKWRPMFNYDQATINNNIFSLKNDAFTLYSKTDGYVIFSDGTKYPGALINFQADTEYTITLQYGPHPDYVNALKMKLIITDGTTIWQSSVVDFDGSFNPADYLSFFFGAEYPQYVKEISIEKESGL